MSQHGLTESDPLANQNPPAPDDAPDLGTDLGRKLNALAIKAAVARRSKARAIEAERVATAAVVAAYGAEGRKQAADPSGSGRVISQVTVDKAGYKATVTDPKEVEQWVRKKYPEKLQKKTRIVPGQEEAVILALRQYAGFLLEEYEDIPDYVISGLLSKCEQAHKPMGWGGEIDDDAPPGIKVEPRSLGVTITYRDADLIDDLIKRGVIDHEGNVLARDSRPRQWGPGDEPPAGVDVVHNPNATGKSDLSLALRGPNGLWAWCWSTDEVDPPYSQTWDQLFYDTTDGPLVEGKPAFLTAGGA